MLRPRKEQMKVIYDISHLVGVEGGKGSLTYFCLLESHNFHLSDIKRNDRSAIAGLKDGGRDTHKGMQAASRNWRRQGNGFSPGSSRKGCSHADTLILAEYHSSPTEPY